MGYRQTKTLIHRPVSHIPTRPRQYLLNQRQRQDADQHDEGCHEVIRGIPKRTNNISDVAIASTVVWTSLEPFILSRPLLREHVQLRPHNDQVPETSAKALMAVNEQW